MPKRKLFYQLIPSYLGLTLAAVALTAWLTLSEVKSFFHDQSLTWLARSANLFAEQIDLLPRIPKPSELDQLCKQHGLSSGIRFTVMELDGTVIGDSDDNPSYMDNHQNRVEFKQALAQATGTSTRFSLTLGEEMLYYARKVSSQRGEFSVIIRTALPLTELEQIHRGVLNKTLLYSLAVAILATCVCFLLSHHITRPLGEMARLAQDYASGNFDKRIRPHGPGELNDLAEALNAMAERVRKQIQLLEDKAHQDLAVFSNMAEGVLAIDRSEHIFLINPAAYRLLGIDDPATSRHLLEVVPDIALHSFLEKLLQAEETQTGPHDSPPTYTELELSPGKLLGIQGAPILGEESRPTGALAVLRDISELRRLETVRKDFVANVSHELKTPITTIKGFVETLLGGALEDTDDAKRFLEIIHKNTDRLTSIIDDLLSLSYMEQSGQRTPPMKHLEISSIIRNVIETCKPGAEKKSISLKTNLDDSLSGIVNKNLLVQALVNLVDNAIKYSEANTEITLSTYNRDGEIILEVKDQGMGIQQDQLDRLFERFYRVDKARSRDLGGTGLGLSIVKHIARVHRGNVSVNSSPGKGSCFRIHLPLVGSDQA